MLMFLIFTLVHIPVFSIYARYTNFNEETGDPLVKTLSLGNMGFSSAKCTSTGMATDKIFLSCRTGNITQIVDFGIQARFEDHDVCLRNSTGACSNSFDKTRLNNDIHSQCVGKRTCKFNNLKSYVTANNATCTHEDA
jgi:hypothetical protein